VERVNNTLLGQYFPLAAPQQAKSRLTQKNALASALNKADSERIEFSQLYSESHELSRPDFQFDSKMVEVGMKSKIFDNEFKQKKRQS